ncbi:MAG: ferric reductase-like transmembrane domain-containing protein, partial [Asgard group archaeon]|nr:ferric reductase-like transmembrane domain-containing protein [Asgard group archaeon]
MAALFVVGATAEEDETAYHYYGSITRFYACNLQLRGSVTYCEKPLYSCLCANKNYLASFAGCLAHNNRNSTNVIDFVTEYCLDNGNVTLAEDWYQESYQYFVENSKSATEIPGFNKSIPIDVPIKLPPAQMDLYQAGYDRYLGNYDDSLYYSAATLGYWLLVFILYAIPHWMKFLFPGLTKKLTSGPINLWRKYISMPATFRKKKAQEQGCLKLFDYLIPTRFETIVIALFYGLTILVNALDIQYVPGDKLFASKYKAEIKYVSDRTGIIATMQIPLIILLAGRNNFLQWLTGISFTTFMTFHRHIARVMYMLVVIHSVGYTIALGGPRYRAEVVEPWFYWGILATVAGGIIWVQAMLFFRRRWYEIFLLIHIVMAALYIAGTWVHVEPFGYVWFVYPAVAVWCFDRAVRIGRLLVFGFPKAEITLLANDTLKVVVPKPSY